MGFLDGPQLTLLFGGWYYDLGLSFFLPLYLFFSGFPLLLFLSCLAITPLILFLPVVCLRHLSLVNLPFLVFINLFPLFLSQFIMLSSVPVFCLSVSGPCFVICIIYLFLPQPIFFFLNHLPIWSDSSF